MIRRDWATPLTIGAFTLMGSTGVLMFFHLDNSLQKAAHEWLGWLMIGAVVLHVSTSWAGFKRYFQPAHRGKWLVGGFVLAVAATFFIRLPGGEGGEGGGQPPGLAISAIRQARIADVAPLFGRTPDDARATLAAGGIMLASNDSTLADAVGSDRGKMGQALRLLAARPGAGAGR